MTQEFLTHLEDILSEIEADGLKKSERLISGPQGGKINVRTANGDREMINLCANNYLGLAHNPEIEKAAAEAMNRFGFGMSSVRFICGTQTIHRQLEQSIAEYVEKDDAILFAAAFDANAALFEPLLGPDDAIISDSLNHASIIDGVRLSKAKRYRYANNDMNALEETLKQVNADGARFKMIITDGVFSMDGYVAQLKEICDLAERYGAMVAVDECHATGHLGTQGRGTPTLTGAGKRVDIITGTFGKTLGGAMGGFIAGPQAVIDILRQRARPYLFSNSLAPALVGGAIKAIEIAKGADDLREKLSKNTKQFRDGLTALGYTVLEGETPIIPAMLGEAHLAQQLASALDERGVYVAGFFFPVVPKGKARIRTQMSAALSENDISNALDAFADAGKSIGII